MQRTNRNLFISKENACRGDISACLEWLYAAGKQPSDIMLYGQSVGSGPSVYLAAVTQDIAGVILHSALASGWSCTGPVLVHNHSAPRVVSEITLKLGLYLPFLALSYVYW